MIWPLQLEMEKKNSRILFSFKKEKKCAQKIHPFLNSLAKFQVVRCKKPTWT